MPENVTHADEKGTQSYFDSEIQLIIFSIKNIEYAINIKNINEIIKYIPLSPLPNAPRFMKEVINLRGKVIPIVDLRQRFLSSNSENTKKTRIMIAHIQDREIGLIADSVSDVIGLAIKQIEPPLPVINGLKMEYIKGIAKLKNRLIIIVNIEKILSSQEKNILQEAINDR